MLRTRLGGAIVTVVTGEKSTVDHVSSPSERALQDGQMAEFGAHRTSMKSSFEDDCDGVLCGGWDAVCVVQFDADFAVVALRAVNCHQPASLEAISNVEISVVSQRNEAIYSSLCS